jgi:MOSC domain-containing protein YiiM
MEKTEYLSFTALEAGLGTILQSPKDHGTLEYIVRRPGVDEREIVSAAALDPQAGLTGDTWSSRGNSPQDPNHQLTLMNARVIALVAGSKDRWALAGDQLFVDLDLSAANLPAGSRLAVGTAIIEISALPHTGCDKFKSRFGRDALLFVNGPEHRDLRLRGVNARILQAGTVRTGDTIRKI